MELNLKIIIETTFTESPSMNVRVKLGASTIFYNSERLMGGIRVRELGKILNITSLPVGIEEHEITQEQYNQIVDLESRSHLSFYSNGR